MDAKHLLTIDRQLLIFSCAEAAVIKITSDAFRNSSYYYMKETENVVLQIEKFLSYELLQPPNKIFEVFFALFDSIFISFCLFSSRLLLLQNTGLNVNEMSCVFSRLIFTINEVIDGLKKSLGLSKLQN